MFVDGGERHKIAAGIEHHFRINKWQQTKERLSANLLAWAKREIGSRITLVSAIDDEVSLLPTNEYPDVLNEIGEMSKGRMRAFSNEVILHENTPLSY